MFGNSRPQSRPAPKCRLNSASPTASDRAADQCPNEERDGAWERSCLVALNAIGGGERGADDSAFWSLSCVGHEEKNILNKVLLQ
jgi:hypothetical protein